MIPERVVEDFLAKKRADFRRFKRLNDGQLLALARQLPVSLPLWKKLRRAQRMCVLIGCFEKRFAFHADTGVGKTLISIVLTRYFRRTGDVRRALILVRNRINKEEWHNEIIKHSPDTSHLILQGSSDQKWDAIQRSDHLITLETYGGLVRMVSEFVEYKDKKKRKKRKLVINPAAVRWLEKHFDMLIMDESTCVQGGKGGGKGSLQFRVCRRLAKSCPQVFELTGTPFGRDPTALWAQLYLIDFGETLGPSIALFRRIFFREVQGSFKTEYHFDKKKSPLLHNLLANKSIRIPANKADLPRLVPVLKKVALSPDLEAYHERAKRAVIAAKGDYKEMQSAFMRMRQISSGFLGYKNDTTGAKAQFEFPYNPKLELLVSILQSLDPKHKAIVFHEFIWSGKRLARELRDKGISHVYIGGANKNEREAKEAKHRFINDPNCSVLLLSNSVVFGLNVQVARYGIFYESPVSPITRYQAVRRVERQYSLHGTVFLYDLICTNTADERILEFLAEGKDLFEAIVEGKARL